MRDDRWSEGPGVVRGLAVRSKGRLEAEIVILRHQLNVLRRGMPSIARLTLIDRLIFVWLYRLRPSVLNAVVIVQPETVVRWHREGFRLYWRWKSRARGGTTSFRAIIESGHVKTLLLPARSPNLNAYAERWVRSVKEECLSKIILFGEGSLRRTMSEYVAHYHAERNHQGKSNALLFHQVRETRREEPVQCRERLGGLLRYYHQDAA
jgi:Integrase core domain